MLHRSYIPALPLGDFVDNFWFFDDYVSPNFKERILPSGTIEMVFNLRDDELRIYDPLQPEPFRRYSGALVSGAYTGFFLIDTVQEASIMGVHFDQSHLIRDFRAFSGLRPRTSVSKEASALTTFRWPPRLPAQPWPRRSEVDTRVRLA